MQIVAAWTKIPVEKLSASNVVRLQQLASHLSSRVVGQPAAVATVARALQRARCGLKDPARPIATLLFAGPTGVGKTCLTNELADYLFDSKVRSQAGTAMAGETSRYPAWICYAQHGGKCSTACCAHLLAYAATHKPVQDSIIRLDMSEYMERFTVAKLVGAPPGYVGFGEGAHMACQPLAAVASLTDWLQVLSSDSEKCLRIPSKRNMLVGSHQVAGQYS